MIIACCSFSRAVFNKAAHQLRKNPRHRFPHDIMTTLREVYSCVHEQDRECKRYVRCSDFKSNDRTWKADFFCDWGAISRLRIGCSNAG